MDTQGQSTPIRLMCLIAALWAPVALASEIYKYTDAQGITHYTNIRPGNAGQYATLRFPCYASDPGCRAVNWEQVPLDTRVFRDEILTAASRYSVDAALIRAIIHAESAYQADAVSPKGAQGLMQLMPGTQRELELADPFNPESNIDGGTYHLAQMLARFSGNLDLVAAAYNAGAGAVQRHGGIPPYAETQEYVRRVKILYRRYQGAGS
jgi:soluble lytic murein transglycosylase-like protein